MLGAPVGMAHSHVPEGRTRETYCVFQFLRIVIALNIGAEVPVEDED